jgi:hypothetical protein
VQDTPPKILPFYDLTGDALLHKLEYLSLRQHRDSPIPQPEVKLWNIA